jgi:hypothetical protein
MKKFTKLFTSSAGFVLLITASVFAQVPADQKVIIVDPGTGTLETTINGDTLDGGVRINPHRVYQLKKDAIYFMNSAILFGGSADSTATLTIVGEPGGKKPVILMDPLDGGNAFTNVVHGSLTIKNVYWPDQALNSTGASLFQMFRSNQRLILQDVVTESVTNGDLFNLEQVRGTMDIYFKNCYFRDNTQFANPWNFATFARGNGAQAIDTLWIENTTVGNAGLTFFGKGCPINFTFFNHNTIINVAKYVFFFEQYKEAYFTSNIFVNCNWQGEDFNMGKSQLESQASSGTGNPPVYVGVLNLMEMNENAWTLGFGEVPAMKDVKWMASNNLQFTSPFLDKYYAGGYGDGQDYPVSYLDWGALPEGTTFPLQVTNVPPMFMSEKTQQLVDEYDGIIAESNHIQVDPMMVTNGIADQAEGDLYAQWARNNFAVPDVTLPDDATFSFGDQDPTTIPGIESEDGDGFTNVTDLLEDFSYTADITSKIDDNHLGSLAWFPTEFETYDGNAALAAVKSYYESLLTPTGIKDNDAKSAMVYPNPTNGILNIDNPSTGSFGYEVINITGKTVMSRSNITGNTTKLNMSGLAKGMYIISVTSEGKSTKHKVVFGDL